MFDGNTNLTYYPDQSANILRAFNEIINGLYHIGNEHEYIIHTLNTSTYVEAEYRKMLSDIGMDLTEIANKLEIVRSLLFGDCLNWEYIYQKVKNIKTKDGEANE